MDVSLNQIDDICRLCLKNGNMQNIFDESIEEEQIFKIMLELIPINIYRNDGYSQNICVECVNQLKNFYKFRLMCVHSEDLMKNKQMRPISRNNEHDYSAWKIDEYDMDLSEYLIEGTSLKEAEPEELTVEMKSAAEKPIFDETQNFDLSSKKVKKRYACPVCAKPWVTPSKLRRHMFSHREKKPKPPVIITPSPPSATPFQCPICNLLVESAEKLTQHLPVHLKVENKASKLQSPINVQHIEYGTPVPDKDSTRYICQVCDHEFLTPSKLQSHMNAQHITKITIKVSPDDPNVSPEKMRCKQEAYPKICEICQKSFVTLSKLKRHIRSHNRVPSKRPPGPRRHECQTCHKKFETPSKLLRHQSVHQPKVMNAPLSESASALEITTVTSILGD